MNIEHEFTFSHSIVFVFDEAAQRDLEFEDAHFQQGFARADTSVAFFMLVPWALAKLNISDGAYHAQDYDRVVQVPLYMPSGSCRIQGPEFDGTTIKLEQGHYKLTCAQRVIEGELVGKGLVALDLFFERLSEPLTSSSILVRDPELIAEVIHEG